MIHMDSFFTARSRIICVLSMASGILMLLVIPAIIAFVFGIWVFYSVLTDVQKRETSQFTVVGPDTIRMRIDPAE
jgi:heme O synthase-like polyprenyltransferase